MLGLPGYILIFDLECTTWEDAAVRDWFGPGEHRELVQLGLALVRPTDFTELDSTKWLVKPKNNPVLSQYFIDLTHITQEEVNKNGLDFQNFLKKFVRFCGEEFELYCFDSRLDGSRLFDRDVLEENCRLRDIKFPFNRERFHNINEVFHRYGVVVRQSGAAPEAFGIKLPARPHDALNDVKGLIIGLKALSERCAGQCAH